MSGKIKAAVPALSGKSILPLIVEQFFYLTKEKVNMKWLRNNGLSLSFLVLFLLSLGGQALTGWKEYNQDMQEFGGRTVRLETYLTTAHFSEATFENWESEFLQMALFVILSMFFYQKGSSESKDPDRKEEVDEKPDPRRKDAPWPVRKGGLVLAVYENSLCYALFLLFFFSFYFHFIGSMKHYNQLQRLKDLPTETASQYITNAKFWFESFQNWQSEFLSVLAIVVLSIFLRQKGSPQSKPVHAPHSQTGD